jgi:type II secretory pathway component PulC
MRWLILILMGAITAPLSADDWRLTGIILHGEGAALIEREGRHFLVRRGETIPGHEPGLCRLVEITGKAARLDCPDGARLLALRPDAQIRPQFGDTHLIRQFGDTHSLGHEVSLDRRQVGQIFEQRQRLVSEMSLAPVMDESGASGYRLTAARPGSLAVRAGFRPGDIVRAVNGVNAGSGSAFMQVLNNLSDAGQVLIGFERDGRSLQALILLE